MGGARCGRYLSSKRGVGQNGRRLEEFPSKTNLGGASAMRLLDVVESGFDRSAERSIRRWHLLVPSVGHERAGQTSMAVNVVRQWAGHKGAIHGVNRRRNADDEPPLGVTSLGVIGIKDDGVAGYGVRTHEGECSRCDRGRHRNTLKNKTGT